MVLIDHNDWLNDILSIAMNDLNHSIVIYVVMDVDSMCSCVMLTVSS